MVAGEGGEQGKGIQESRLEGKMAEREDYL